MECPVGGNNIKVRFKEPSNAGWNEILFEGTRYPIASATINGQNSSRQSYNYWTTNGGSSFDITLTDVNGSTVSFTVNLGSGAIDAGVQFPVCQ